MGSSVVEDQGRTSLIGVAEMPTDSPVHTAELADLPPGRFDSYLFICHTTLRRRQYRMASSALDRTRSPDWPTPSADATGDATGAVERGDDTGAPGDIDAVTTKASAENGPARMAPALGAVTDGSDLFAQALLGTRAGDEGRTVGDGSPLSAELFARVSKALADPRRFSILEIIAA